MWPFQGAGLLEFDELAFEFHYFLVSLLIWLIQNNYLASKRLKKINENLPSVLETDFSFSQRYLICLFCTKPVFHKQQQQHEK